MENILRKKIVVFGGNGTLGSASVKVASEHGARVTIVSPHAELRGGAVEAIQGSISSAHDVLRAVEGADGVVIAVEGFNSLQETYVKGAQTVIDTVSPSTHIIFMGNIGVTDMSRMPDYNQAKLQAEQLIRSSGLSYTIIRPSWIVSRKTGIKLEQGDRYTGRRDDVAHQQLGETVVAAFENLESRGKTFELYGGGAENPNWRAEFARLEADV